MEIAMFQTMFRSPAGGVASANLNSVVPVRAWSMTARAIRGRSMTAGAIRGRPMAARTVRGRSVMTARTVRSRSVRPSTASAGPGSRRGPRWCGPRWRWTRRRRPRRCGSGPGCGSCNTVPRKQGKNNSCKANSEGPTKNLHGHWILFSFQFRGSAQLFQKWEPETWLMS